MATRLDTVSADLVSTLRLASGNQLRLALLTACEFAVLESELKDALIDAILDEIREKGVASADLRRRANLLTEELDDRYFALQEAAEESRTGQFAYLNMFRKARAAAAVAYACCGTAFDTVVEAIYEATAATEHVDELTEMVEKALGNTKGC